MNLVLSVESGPLKRITLSASLAAEFVEQTKDKVFLSANHIVQTKPQITPGRAALQRRQLRNFEVRMFALENIVKSLGDAKF